MTINLRPGLFFLIASLVCAVVWLLLALNVFTGSNQEAWQAGAFVALVLSFIAP
jgi:hypothetical protein